MADKRFLHELLEEDQDPFHLKSYIAGKLSQLQNPSTSDGLQIRKRKPVAAEETVSKFTSFCFYSFKRSSGVENPPFVDFQSPPTVSPDESPVYLRVPPRTAALLVKAAMRIQEQQQSNRRAEVGILGFGMLGSFVKRLKDRGRQNKKRAIGGKILGNLEEESRISRSSNEIRLNNRFNLREFTCDPSEEIAVSPPLHFSLHRSASAGSHTPEFRSPADSRSLISQQVQSNPQEEKQHCSPVSVLDSFFHDEHLIGEPESDGYTNIQRVKKQLLLRLRRFEKLAEFDPIDLDKDFVESNSDDNEEWQSIEGSCSPGRGKDIDLEVFNLANLQHKSTNTKGAFDVQKEAWGKTCKKFNTSKEVDMLTFEGEWETLSKEVKEAAKEVELAIIEVLVDEVIDL